MLETLTAIYGPALRGLEWNRSFTLTSRADGFGLHPLKIAAAAGEPHCVCPLGFAIFAAFRLIAKLLIVEEQLFPGREDEVCATISALQNLILELHRDAPFLATLNPT